MSAAVMIPESELKDLAVTPVFKFIQVENIHKSEQAGHAVMETREVVELHIAGRTNCVHVANATDFSRREGNRQITYAEEYAEQYRAFREGSPQEAQGTPLESLRQFGVSAAMISLCRARNIYSVEALHQLEGPALKSLGIEANALKDACRKYLAERTDKLSAMDEIAELRSQIEQLKLATAQQVGDEPVATEETPDPFAGFSDDDIKEMIAGKVGARPKGNPNRNTLIQMARELEAA